MKFEELLSKIGIGTPLHIIEDGDFGDEYMKSATLCDFDITDPDFQAVFSECKEREISSITVKTGDY